jgi:glutathione-regulated potassium-efflux system ancillary protein KefC/glutathione-regulated potassium-efflux system protein KefB
MHIGITTFKRETFDSALNLGVEVLTLLGNDSADAKRAGEIFAQHDEESLIVLAELWGDDHSYGIAVKQRIEDLKQVLSKDNAEQGKLNTCRESVCEESHKDT